MRDFQSKMLIGLFLDIDILIICWITLIDWNSDGIQYNRWYLNVTLQTGAVYVLNITTANIGTVFIISLYREFLCNVFALLYSKGSTTLCLPVHVECNLYKLPKCSRVTRKRNSVKKLRCTNDNMWSNGPVVEHAHLSAHKKSTTLHNGGQLKEYICIQPKSTAQNSKWHNQPDPTFISRGQRMSRKKDGNWASEEDRYLCSNIDPV